MNDTGGRIRGHPVLQAIRTRRVVRSLTTDPVERADLEAVIDSARYAPRAGNRHIHRYVVVNRPALLHALRMVSPGMLQAPTAAIVVCVDWARAESYGFTPADAGPYVDVGTATATMLLAAHALGLGSGPVTSFSRTAAATLLGLPETVRPELIVCLGNPAAGRTPSLRRRPENTWADVVSWNRATSSPGPPDAQGPTARNHETEERRVWSRIREIDAGYEDNSAAAFLDVYADDAELTNVFGETFQGRDAILGRLRALFTDPRFLAGRWAGSPRTHLRWVTDDVVVVKTYREREGQQTADGSVLPRRRTHSIKVFHREDEAWRVVSDFYMDARDESAVGPEPETS
ncbi:nitroreductase family protein [Streptomyces sp. IBSNAI002]|uniref:nitroreductase family protein n=1 Tax=Streptomyces sp. IBSNAI002 TaxID=3457500 RepID=UPI003FD2FE60